jgi:hypothetical protein
VTSTLVVVTVVSVSDISVASSAAEIRLPNWTHTPVAIAQVAVAVGGIGGIWVWALLRLASVAGVRTGGDAGASATPSAAPADETYAAAVRRWRAWLAEAGTWALRAAIVASVDALAIAYVGPYPKPNGGLLQVVAMVVAVVASGTLLLGAFCGALLLVGVIVVGGLGRLYSAFRWLVGRVVGEKRAEQATVLVVGLVLVLVGVSLMYTYRMGNAWVQLAGLAVGGVGAVLLFMGVFG